MPKFLEAVSRLQELKAEIEARPEPENYQEAVEINLSKRMWEQLAAFIYAGLQEVPQEIHHDIDFIELVDAYRALCRALGYKSDL